MILFTAVWAWVPYSGKFMLRDYYETCYLYLTKCGLWVKLIMVVYALYLFVPLPIGNAMIDKIFMESKGETL